jgi:hypothetical protein
MIAMTISPRFWRVLTSLARLDIAVGLAITAGLLFRLTWH